MTIEGISRFRDLVEAVVDGNFYKGIGIILPYKTVPTQLRLETGSANTKFGIYVNEIFIGEVMSDTNGNVVFNYIFPLGEIEVSVINSVSSQRVFTYLTVRDWALWLAAYAEVLEEVDDNIQEIQDDLSIETVTSRGIEDHFGKYIDIYNNMGQSLDSYRWMIHELRMAYRNTGTRFWGIESAVAAFTQITPFGYSRRMWGPNWFVDQSMLINHRFKNRSHSVYDLSAPVNITGVTLLKVEADVSSSPSTPHSLGYNNTSNTLTWTPDGSAGTPVLVADGELFLPGPNHTTPAYLLGRDYSVNPLSVVVGSNDNLYLNIDDIGSIIINLVTGLPAPTPAQVVGDINTAIVADVRYGAPYAAFAAVYNNKILLQSIAAAGSSIVVEHGVDNAACEVFGNDPGDLVFDRNLLNGVEILDFYGYISILEPPNIIEYEYDDSVSPITRRLRWRTSITAFGAWVSIISNGSYSVYDLSGNEMRVYCYYDYMDVLSGPFPAVSSNSFPLGFQKSIKNIEQTQGLWVSCDTSSLPGSTVSDTIKVYDDEDDGFDETPDYWSVVNPSGSLISWIEVSDIIEGKHEDLDPAPAFKWRVTDSSVNTIQFTGRVHKWPMPRPGPRGSNYPQENPGLFYDYEGFETEFGVWIRNYINSAGTATLSFSFDNGSSWVSGAATPIITDVGGSGYEDPTHITFSTVIPSDITDNGVLVRIQIDVPGSTIDVSVDSPSVGVKYISSRYLTNATVSRYRHDQYFGELMWCWSPNRLSLKEKEYIGLQHKSSDKTTIYSGVIIIDISSDVEAGVGSLEYEYNGLPITKRLRWNSPNSSWGVGLGWVLIAADTITNLAAPDGSFVTVNIIYNSMPVISGSPPAVSESKNVTIIDDIINQGSVRKISPSSSSIDIHDVSEYTSIDVPINLFGGMNEGDFPFGTLINLDVSSAEPFRFSYLYPTLESVEGEELVIATPAPHLATLDYQSDQNQTTAVLFEDGLPVSNDSWQFNVSNQIQILTTGLSPYNSSAVYTISYDLLYQYTSHFINLGATTYQDYAWFADYFMWDRMDSVEGNYTVTVPISFNPDNGRAFLDKQSAMNISTAKLNVQEGSVYREIPKRYWRFRNAKTVEIDSAYLTSGAQYYLEHQESRVYEQSRLTITFEHKSGTNSTTCSAASWNTIQRNENVDVHTSNHLIHQLRLSISGIRDLRDFKVRSIVLKGLHIHGSSPSVPGLTNIWGL